MNQLRLFGSLFLFFIMSQTHVIAQYHYYGGMGYGFYESFHLSFGLQNENFKYQFSAGRDHGIFDEDFMGLSLLAGIKVIKDDNASNSLLSDIYINGKFEYWRLEDGFYIFNGLVLSPGLIKDFHVTHRLFLSARVGPEFPIVLKSKRKTFEEVGWPNKISPGVCITIFYLL